MDVSFAVVWARGQDVAVSLSDSAPRNRALDEHDSVDHHNDGGKPRRVNAVSETPSRDGLLRGCISTPKRNEQADALAIESEKESY